MQSVQMRQKLGIVGAICASTAVVAALAGCAVSSGGNPAGSTEQTAAPTYQELIEMYPDEYNSAMTHKTDEEGEDNSHAGFQALMETPAVRDGGGAILEVVDVDDPRKTEIQVSCLSCKSSAVNEFFEEEGYGVFAADRVLSEDDMEALDGRYWDCYGCHVWDGEGLSLSANMIYANEDVFATQAAFYNSLAPKEAVCGQCHNLSNARKHTSNAEDAEAYTIYADGVDPDVLFENEYATAEREEDSGVYEAWINHPQIESFQGSIHQAMGLGCVDCHMPVVEKEDGTTYREHNASGSVYENDNAMEFCLTCHTNQSGVQSIEEMRAFLKNAQDEQMDHHLSVKQSLGELKELLVAQTQNQTVDDETLEQCRENYSRAFYFMEFQQGNRFDPIDGAEIPHNPSQFKELLNRADELVAESKALLS